MKTIPFKPLCWKVNEKCDSDAAIYHAGYHSPKKNSRKKLPSFLCFFTRPALPLSVHGTLLLLLMLLMTTAKKKKH